MKNETDVNEGKRGQAWPAAQILAQARDFLRLGGSQARREIVRTTLALSNILKEAN